MSQALTIKVTVKDDKAHASIIDREVRWLLRDNLEAAVNDLVDGLICDYQYETEVVKLQIKHS